ncbi:hypothetical protein ABT174_06290, partial [Streptomyces sparsogenes]|uniref:hypothetical protein n=1 Tax=Streptomyces sparsogenes TaxID=67365 RepID=UPI0033295466
GGGLPDPTESAVGIGDEMRIDHLVLAGLLGADPGRQAAQTGGTGCGRAPRRRAAAGRAPPGGIL